MRSRRRFSRSARAPSPSSTAAMNPCSSPSPARSDCGATRWCAPCSKSPDADHPMRQPWTPRAISRRLPPRWVRTSPRPRACRAVENQDWERVWLADWKSMRFGRRLWVCPTAAAPPDDPQAVVVRLDPGLAFGTGTHPTTALCLQILDSLPICRPQRHRLRLRLRHPGDCRAETRRGPRDGGRSGPPGAARDARQRDSQRRRLEHRRARRRCGGRRHGGRRGDAGHCLAAPAYCVMANILAGPLIELAPKLTAACEPGGYLLLSGLLEDPGLRGKSRLRRVLLIWCRSLSAMTGAASTLGEALKLFTQCSKCETVFKLSAEVLRAAGGQVRCGKCGEVFNALARLAEDSTAFSRRRIAARPGNARRQHSGDRAPRRKSPRRWPRTTRNSPPPESRSRGSKTRLDRRGSDAEHRCARRRRRGRRNARWSSRFPRENSIGFSSNPKSVHPRRRPLRCLRRCNGLRSQGPSLPESLHRVRTALSRPPPHPESAAAESPFARRRTSGFEVPEDVRRDMLAEFEQHIQPDEPACCATPGAATRSAER